MAKTYAVVGALVASALAGYGLAERPSLPEAEAPAPETWSLPEPASPDLTAARERLADTRAWQDADAADSDGSSEGDGSDEATDTTGDDAERGWAFHGVVVDGGERTALITTAEGEVLRLGRADKLPNGARLATIRVDFIEVESPDGERRYRLYRQR